MNKTDEIFRYNSKINTLTLRTPFGYPYEIDLDTIESSCELAEWAKHLSEKAWMTGFLVEEFIDRVKAIKVWT
jgi:hypothetical protein